MQPKHERYVLAVSVVLLVAAALVIPFGLVDVAPSLPLLALFLALTAAGAAAQQRLSVPPTVGPLWAGPAIAAGLTLLGVVRGWIPGELQAAAGVVGLAGFLNLFLRPAYRALEYVVGVVLQIAREIEEERS